MAELTIGDQVINVDDSFLKLSPQDQQKTVDEIEHSLGGGARQQPRHDWSELPGNIIPSAINTAEGIYNTVRHPVETFRTLDDAATGGLPVNAKNDLDAWLAAAKMGSPQTWGELYQIGTKATGDLASTYGELAKRDDNAVFRDFLDATYPYLKAGATASEIFAQ